MKKVILSFAILALLSCEKEDDSLLCETNNTGEFQIINSSNDSYYIYIDNVYQRTLSASSYYKTDVKAGFHLIKFEQADGFIFSATIEEFSGTVVQCEELVVSN